MDHILHITADNASTNLAMARHIQFESEQSFQAEDQLLGCVAHVLNLAAQDGLKALGSDNLNLDEVSGLEKRWPSPILSVYRMDQTSTFVL